MSHPKLAAQLYTVRDYTRTTEDFRASIKKIADIGYTAVQVSGIGPIPHEQVKAITDEFGLTICITHVGFDYLQNDTETAIAQHKLWNCPNVAVGSMPVLYREGGLESFKRFAKDATEIGKKLAGADLTFSYHNHSFEFVRFGDRTGLDVIYEESDPRYLQAEIDTYWVQHGGGDSIAWIKKMTGRMPVIHFKDMVIVEGQQTMAEIGEGNLNWPGIIEACEEAGVEWYAIEQDRCLRDPFESLKISYNNLRAMGVE
ncbi:MAG: sugar phosphate isomerase/epimerase [Anaerolineae bacterium]|nr:sugar phosphate isomerase/epimerase [Anaerolineae bacterium]